MVMVSFVLRDASDVYVVEMVVCIPALGVMPRRVVMARMVAVIAPMVCPYDSCHLYTIMGSIDVAGTLHTSLVATSGASSARSKPLAIRVTYWKDAALGSRSIFWLARGFL